MDFDDLDAAEEEADPSPKELPRPAAEETQIADPVQAGQVTVEDVLRAYATPSDLNDSDAGQYEWVQTNTGSVKVKKLGRMSKEDVLQTREALQYNIQLPPQDYSQHSTAMFFERLQAEKFQVSAEHISEDTYTLMKRLVGGGQHSYTVRQIEIVAEDGTQSLTIGAFTSTTVKEVKDLVAALTETAPGSLRLTAKKGAYWKQLADSNQCASRVKVSGTRKLTREVWVHKKPIVILGAGYGGISSMLRLKRSGRENFVCMEKLHDFGGRSWIIVANKHTKLQTEKGTYHVKYMFRDGELPHYMPTWPSRDQVIDMFRREARYFNLDAHTAFNTEIRNVPDPPWWTSRTDPCTNLSEREFKIEYGHVGGGEAKTMQCGMVLAWPGNLSNPRVMEIPGEDVFDGYIAYGSGGATDYDQCEGKNTILYGHGAFMIENVRTAVEYGATTIYIVCRRKNLTAPKMISWLISQTNAPGTGALMMNAFAPMYALAGLDPWTYHSVTKNQDRTYARIDQTTVFGVTDIYFLAQYYGKAQLVESDIKRLGPHCAYLRNSHKLQCEVILKVLGIVPDAWVDKVMNIDHCLGIFVNGDPLRICMSNGMHVSAQNFGTFSVGPGITFYSCVVQYFVDFPQDLLKIRESLPKAVARDGVPAYAYSQRHFMSTTMVMTGSLGLLALRVSEFDGMKSEKQHRCHPLHEYLEECKTEWQMYIEMFGHEYPGKAPPPYPYTEESILEFINQINREAAEKYENAGATNEAGAGHEAEPTPI